MEEIIEFVDEVRLREMFNILDAMHGYDTTKIPIEINRGLDDAFAMLNLDKSTLEPLNFVFCTPSLVIINEKYLWEVVKHEYAHYIDICINKSGVEDPHGSSFRELSYELEFDVVTEEDSEFLLKLIMCDYEIYCIDEVLKKTKTF